jgi:hypothetical protein
MPLLQPKDRICNQACDVGYESGRGMNFIALCEQLSHLLLLVKMKIHVTVG